MIGRFYNGRDHSTVCHGIQRIEALRESDPEVDLLISDLKHELTGVEANASEIEDKPSNPPFSQSVCNLERLAELIAERICRHLEQRTSAK